jgi:hypothetical protein
MASLSHSSVRSHKKSKRQKESTVSNEETLTHTLPKKVKLEDKPQELNSSKILFINSFIVKSV